MFHFSAANIELELRNMMITPDSQSSPPARPEDGDVFCDRSVGTIIRLRATIRSAQWTTDNHNSEGDNLNSIDKTAVVGGTK